MTRSCHEIFIIVFWNLNQLTVPQSSRNWKYSSPLLYFMGNLQTEYANSSVRVHCLACTSPILYRAVPLLQISVQSRYTVSPLLVLLDTFSYSVVDEEFLYGDVIYSLLSSVVNKQRLMKVLLDHSINQATHQSISQLINQPISQPINQSINRLIDQSINQSINQAVSQSISH